MKRNIHTIQIWGWPAIAVLMVLLAGILLGQFVFGRELDGNDVSAEQSALSRVSTVCAICGNGDGIEYRAPVLVNLSTGEVGELRVYETTQPSKKPSISPVQKVGTFHFSKCAGLTGSVETYSHMHTIKIPEKSEGIVMEHFCGACRVVLASAATRGYALLDLRDLKNVRAYPLEEGAYYKIREYDVSIFRGQDDSEITVRVEGNMEGLTFVD